MEQQEYSLPVKVFVLLAMLFLVSLLPGSGFLRGENGTREAPKFANEQASLPMRLGDIGPQMVAAGVIDKDKFLAPYRDGSPQRDFAERLLTTNVDEALVITQENSGVLLNFLWAFGLANKNRILTEGPMMDSKYGGAGRFASTGGWTLARGGAMEHYSRHVMAPLTPGQQALVERMSKNIYRPCCGNATYFPDCNHGMAMLGLLELMASGGMGESEMYDAALAVNSFWFPDTYLAIGRYLQLKGKTAGEIGAQELLGANFSSSSGYRKILSEVPPAGDERRSSCGV